MNICVITQQVKKTISGVGLHTHNLVHSLVQDGHNVWVISPEEQRPSGNLGFQFIGVPSPLFKENQARWISLSYTFAQALYGLLKNEPIDLVHFTDAREAFFFRTQLPIIGNINDTYSAELHPISYYRRYYDDWGTRWLYYRLVHYFEKNTLSRLSAVIANSHFTANVICNEYKVSPEKIYTCYKSVDSKKYQAVHEKRDNYRGVPQKVLFVGTNMQRKGLPTLIQAAPEILKELPGIEFWIVGEDRVIPRMKQMCSDLNVAGSFTFLGWKSQKDLVEIYAQSSVFVMPSLTEALGVAFLEAMAAGVPVVGTSVGGIPEIIQNGENGRLVPPDHPVELAQAIVEILRDRQVTERYREAGLQTVDKFTVEKMMDSTYEIYRAASPLIKV